jgi:hypothetical protein
MSDLPLRHVVNEWMEGDEAPTRVGMRQQVKTRSPTQALIEGYYTPKLLHNSHAHASCRSEGQVAGVQA